MHPLRTASNIQLQLEFVTASCKNTSGRETVLIWPHCPNWSRLLVPLTVSWTCQLNNNHFDVCFLHMLSRPVCECSLSSKPFAVIFFNVTIYRKVRGFPRCLSPHSHLAHTSFPISATCDGSPWQPCCCPAGRG